jgi:hypothetical protein
MTGDRDLGFGGGAVYHRPMLRRPSPLFMKPFLYGETRDRGDLGD